MTKLFEHPTTQDIRELPELPHDVVVPDDISGLEVDQQTGPGRREPRVRWLRWMAAAVLLIAAGFVIREVVRDDGTTPVETTPGAYQLIQEEIDQALLENQGVTVVTTPGAYQLIQEEIDQALLENQGVTVETTPSAYQLIQEEIDQALQENQGTTVETTPSAYQLIQDEIDQALQENR